MTRKKVTKIDKAPAAEESIDQLRDRLARQVLQIALESTNETYKLDAYRATNPPANRGRPSSQKDEAPDTVMSVFQRRLRAAEKKENLNGSRKSSEASE